MPMHTGGLAVARAASADEDDPVLSTLRAELTESRTEAAAAAAAFAAICCSECTLKQLEAAAAEVYLSAGRVVALTRRIHSR